MTKKKSKIEPQEFAGVYLSRRTTIVFVLTFLLLFFLAKQQAHVALMMGVILAGITFLISSQLQKPINRVLIDKVALRNESKSDRLLSRQSTTKDNLIYAFDFGLAINLPIIATGFILRNQSIADNLSALYYSNQLWIILILLSTFYTGLLFFVYKKRYFVAYTILLLTVPIALVLDFYGDILGLSRLTKRFFFVYGVIMGIFLAAVTAFDYFDENIQKREGKVKIMWNKIIGFVAWDFLQREGKKSIDGRK